MITGCIAFISLEISSRFCSKVNLSFRASPNRCFQKVSRVALRCGSTREQWTSCPPEPSFTNSLQLSHILRNSTGDVSSVIPSGFRELFGLHPTLIPSSPFALAPLALAPSIMDCWAKASCSFIKVVKLATSSINPFSLASHWLLRVLMASSSLARS